MVHTKTPPVRPEAEGERREAEGGKPPVLLVEIDEGGAVVGEGKRPREAACVRCLPPSTPTHPRKRSVVSSPRSGAFEHSLADSWEGTKPSHEPAPGGG